MYKNEYDYAQDGKGKSILVLRLRRYGGGLRKSVMAFANALTGTALYSGAIVGQFVRLIIVAFSNTFKTMFREVYYFLAAIMRIVVGIFKAPFEYFLVPCLKWISEALTSWANAAEERPEVAVMTTFLLLGACGVLAYFVSQFM